MYYEHTVRQSIQTRTRTDKAAHNSSVKSPQRYPLSIHTLIRQIVVRLFGATEYSLLRFITFIRITKTKKSVTIFLYNLTIQYQTKNYLTVGIIFVFVSANGHITVQQWLFQLVWKCCVRWKITSVDRFSVTKIYQTNENIFVLVVLVCAANSSRYIFQLQQSANELLSEPCNSVQWHYTIWQVKWLKLFVTEFYFAGLKTFEALRLSHHSCEIESEVCYPSKALKTIYQIAILEQKSKVLGIGILLPRLTPTETSCFYFSCFPMITSCDWLTKEVNK